MSLTKVWNCVRNLGYHLRCQRHDGKRIVLTSGYFAPVTRGHVRLFQQAKSLGDLVVVVNGNNALQNKKGFIPQYADERCEVIAALACVDYVVIHDHDNVSGALDILRPHVFAKGGSEYLNEKSVNTDELSVCKRLGIEILFGVGGDTKVASSSDVFQRHLQWLTSQYSLVKLLTPEERKKIAGEVRDSLVHVEKTLENLKNSK